MPKENIVVNPDDFFENRKFDNRIEDTPSNAFNANPIRTPCFIISEILGINFCPRTTTTTRRITTTTTTSSSSSTTTSTTSTSTSSTTTSSSTSTTTTTSSTTTTSTSTTTTTTTTIAGISVLVDFRTIINDNPIVGYELYNSSDVLINSGTFGDTSQVYPINNLTFPFKLKVKLQDTDFIIAQGHYDIKLYETFNESSSNLILDYSLLPVPYSGTGITSLSNISNTRNISLVIVQIDAIALPTTTSTTSTSSTSTTSTSSTTTSTSSTTTSTSSTTTSSSTSTTTSSTTTSTSSSSTTTTSSTTSTTSTSSSTTTSTTTLPPTTTTTTSSTSTTTTTSTSSSTTSTTSSSTTTTSTTSTSTTTSTTSSSTTTTTTTNNAIPTFSFQVSSDEFNDEVSSYYSPYTPPSGRTFNITPDVNGRVQIDNSNNFYLPGDTLIMSGNYSYVSFTNLSGTLNAPIRIKNNLGQLTTIGDPTWAGGSWASALVFSNCHYIVLGADTVEDRNNFYIHGSEDVATRNAYFNLTLKDHADNFEIKNLLIYKGGTGIWAKTDPVESNPSTWYPNSYMYSLKIHDVEISDTNNENMYIGHTATWWNLTKNTSYYGIYGDTSDPNWYPNDHYVQPIKWQNVEIYNNYCHDGYADGIQTAAIEGLLVHHNEVINWGRAHNSSHNGGILIGGRVRNFEAYCNYVHDGWGELLQCYAEGIENAYGKVYNNLFRTNQNDGVTFRITDNLVIDLYDNTIVATGGVSTRFYTGAGHRLNRNLLIQPRTLGGTIFPTAYIYLEPGITVTEGTGSNSNGKFLTVTDANVDPNNWYLPNPGSPAQNMGYRRANCI